MPQKAYEIAFKIAANRSGQFSSAFSEAQDSVESLQERIERLNKSSNDVGSLLKARKAVGENAKAYIQAKERVAELGKAISKATVPSKELQKQFTSAKASLDRAKKSLERSRSELKSLDSAMGANGATISQLVKRQKELEEATKRATSAQENQEKIQKRIEKIGKIQSSFSKGPLISEGISGAITVAGGLITKFGSEAQKAFNTLQARTGVTAQEMQKLQTSVRSVYNSGVGESLAEVSEAMAIMRQVSGLTGQSLNQATKDAIVLSKTFNMDVSESARAASALMKNFGISSKEAYDLIAYAAQNGANKNGDLLDTLNEYSVQYKAMGFSAEEFTAHLIKGAQDGAFSIDKLGDAIKEFNIRAKDGSKSSMEAFAMLGLSGQTATQMFAAGGKDAQMAFTQVVERLKAMDDPVKQNAIAVALFGTQFEDLQGKALDGFASIQGASINAKGAMENVTKLSTKDLSSQLSILSRQITDALIPSASEASDSIVKSMPTVQNALASILPVIHKVSEALTSKITLFADRAASAIERLGKVASYVFDHWDTISSIVSAVVKALTYLKIAQIAALGLLQLYKWGLMVHKAFTVLRGSAALATIATKAVSTAAFVGSSIMKGFSIAVRGVGLALKFLAANPMVLVLGALAALAIAGNYIIKNWDSVKAKAVELYQGFKTNLVDAMMPLVEQFQGIWTSIQAVFTNVVELVKNVFTGEWAAAWENVKNIFANVFNSLAGLVKAPFNAIIGLVNSVIKSINKIGSVQLPELLGGGQIGLALPEIPFLANGGIATKPVLAAIAEGSEPEAVIPLSKLEQMLSPPQLPSVQTIAPQQPLISQSFSAIDEETVRGLDPAAEPPESSPLSRAARALGMGSSPSITNVSENQPLTVNFSPVINVNGGDSSVEERIRRALEEGQRQFEEKLQQLLDRNARLAY